MILDSQDWHRRLTRIEERLGEIIEPSNDRITIDDVCKEIAALQEKVDNLTRRLEDILR